MKEQHKEYRDNEKLRTCYSECWSVVPVLNVYCARSWGRTFSPLVQVCKNNVLRIPLQFVLRIKTVFDSHIPTFWLIYLCIAVHLQKASFNFSFVPTDFSGRHIWAYIHVNGLGEWNWPFHKLFAQGSWENSQFFSLPDIFHLQSFFLPLYLLIVFSGRLSAIENNDRNKGQRGENDWQREKLSPIDSVASSILCL